MVHAECRNLSLEDVQNVLACQKPHTPARLESCGADVGRKDDFFRFFSASGMKGSCS